MVMRPKPTGFSKDARDKLREMLKKKKKDSLKDKVKKKLKDKKKTKSTKTGLLSKAGLMPVSTPGGIPKVMSQKTAQKDPPKRRPMPGKPKDRMPPELLRPKNPPRKFMPMSPDLRKKMKQMGVIMRAPGGDVKSLASAATSINSMIKAIEKNPGLVGMNKKVMDLAKKIKPSGRLSVDDLKRARAMLRKGQKPVLDSKGKPVKNLTQKAGPGKPMSPEARKQLRRLLDNVNMRMPKRQKKGPKAMTPLMGVAGKGMRKGFGSRNLKAAAKKLKRIM